MKLKTASPVFPNSHCFELSSQHFIIILALKLHSSSKDDRVLGAEIRPWTKFVINHKLHYVGEKKDQPLDDRFAMEQEEDRLHEGTAERVPLRILTDP